MGGIKMKFTITIRRRTNPNTYDSIMVLISESYNEYLAAFNSLEKMFKRNKTLICKEILQDEDVIRGFIEYDLSKGE